MKDSCVIGRTLTGETIVVAPEGGTGSADDIGCGQPVGSAIETIEEMLFLRGKDTRLLTPPGTGDVGGLGVELLGGDHDLIVSAALSLVTGDNITVAKWRKPAGTSLPSRVSSDPSARRRLFC